MCVLLTPMLNTLIELVRSWPVIGQIVFVLIYGTLVTTIVLALIGTIGDFITNGLTVLLRGYPPAGKDDVETEEETEVK